MHPTNAEPTVITFVVSSLETHDAELTSPMPPGTEGC